MKVGGLVKIFIDGGFSEHKIISSSFGAKF